MALVSTYQSPDINMAIKTFYKRRWWFLYCLFLAHLDRVELKIISMDGDGLLPSSWIFEPTIGISENNSTVHVGDIFPNPVSAESVINVLVDNAQQVEFTIVDLSGRTVKTNSMNLKEGDNQVSIDSSNLPSGAYRIVISSKDSLMTRMFVKK